MTRDELLAAQKWNNDNIQNAVYAGISDVPVFKTIRHLIDRSLDESVVSGRITCGEVLDGEARMMVSVDLGTPIQIGATVSMHITPFDKEQSE